MGAQRSQSFLSQPDGWVNVNVSNVGALTVEGACDATIARTGQGVYDVTFATSLGAVGLATTGANGGVEVDFDGAAGFFWRVDHQTDLVKRITFTDSADAVQDPTRIAVRGFRFS